MTPNKPNPKSKPKAEARTVLHINFDDETIAGLAALAERLGKTTGTTVRQTDLVRRAVKELLEREAKK